MEPLWSPVVATRGNRRQMVRPAPRLVPSPPRKVGVPLGVGAWVNANAFGVLAFRPDLKDHSVYRASVATPFVAASWGFTGLAAVAWKRWLEER